MKNNEPQTQDILGALGKMNEEILTWTCRNEITEIQREQKLKSATVKIKSLSRSLEGKYPSLKRHQ